MARIYFRAQKTFPDRARHMLVVGAGTLGQKVKVQLLESELPNLIIAGFVDDHTESLLDAKVLLGNAGEIRDVLKHYEITDAVIALPYSEYHQMGDIIQKM